MKETSAKKRRPPQTASSEWMPLIWVSKTKMERYLNRIVDFLSAQEYYAVLKDIYSDVKMKALRFFETSEDIPQ